MIDLYMSGYDGGRDHAPVRWRGPDHRRQPSPARRKRVVPVSAFILDRAVGALDPQAAGGVGLRHLDTGLDGVRLEVVSGQHLPLVGYEPLGGAG